jgi:tRNA 2-thiocytidine biosynthesis protein TtcA
VSQETPVPDIAPPPPGSGLGAPVRPPRTLLRAVGRAVVDFSMIGEGDRVLLGLSGGKDSLGLLHLLLHLRRHAPVRFEVVVATVDFQVTGSRLTELRGYMRGFDVVYHYHAEPMVERAKEQLRGDSFGSYGARMRRGILYGIARREGCTTLALAQHLDDIAESLLMSMFHGGSLHTMKAHYRIDAGDLRVIRPLAYARERQLADFARSTGLPVIPDVFPAGFRPGGERRRIKSLLADLELEYRHLFPNLLRAMRPLLSQEEHAREEPGGTGGE